MISALVAVALVAGIGYVLARTAVIVASAVRHGGRRIEANDDEGTLLASRFTIPVSIIVPALADSHGTPATVRSLLALDYPELEVIVASEDPPGDEIDALSREWDLQPKEVFYRRTLTTSPIHRILQSGLDPRLMVVRKESASEADALNCALNLARFRYVGALAPGSELAPDGLVRTMSPALRDPAHVLAASAHIERRGGAGWGAAFQRLDSLRSILESRVLAPEAPTALRPADAFTVWRRDALVEVRGFDVNAGDPYLDALVRLERAAESGARVIRLPEIVGCADTMPMADFTRALIRRQAAVLSMALHDTKRASRREGRAALARLIEAEIVLPAVQAVVAGAALGAAVGGVLTLSGLGAALTTLALAAATVSTAALLVRGASPDSPQSSELRRLVAVAPFELLAYQPALAWARMKGILQALGSGR